MHSFGKAKFTKTLHGSTEFFIVRYASKRYPGHDFTFKRPGSTKNNRSDGLYHCVDCRTLKNKYGLNYQVPSIKIVNSIIAEFDPDSPKYEHFCVPETEKYPFSQNGSAVLLRELVISKKKKAPSEAFQNSKEKEAIKKNDSAKESNKENENLSNEIKDADHVLVQNQSIFEEEEPEEGALKISEEEIQVDHAARDDNLKENEEDEEKKSEAIDQVENQESLELTLELSGSVKEENELDALIFGMSPAVQQNVDKTLNNEKPDEVHPNSFEPSSRSNKEDSPKPSTSTSQTTEIKLPSKYCAEYEETFPEIGPSEMGRNYFNCKICQQDLCFSNKGLKSVQRHLHSTRHLLTKTGKLAVKPRKPIKFRSDKGQKVKKEVTQAGLSISPKKAQEINNVSVDIGSIKKQSEITYSLVTNEAKKTIVKIHRNTPIQMSRLNFKKRSEELLKKAATKDKLKEKSVIENTGPSSGTRKKRFRLPSGINIPLHRKRSIEDPSTSTAKTHVPSKSVEADCLQSVEKDVGEKRLREFDGRRRGFDGRRRNGRAPRDSSGKFMPKVHVNSENISNSMPNLDKDHVNKENDLYNLTQSSTSISFSDDHSLIKRIKMEQPDFIDDPLPSYPPSLIASSTATSTPTNNNRSTFSVMASKSTLQFLSPILPAANHTPKIWSKTCLLSEISHLTKKVYIQTSEWDDPDFEIRLPNSDVPVPAKKNIDLETLLQSDHRKIAKKRLANEFNAVNKAFIETPTVNSIVITDSLLQGLDEAALEKVVVIRAEFPIIPRWLSNHITAINFAPKPSATIYYSLGFDWLVHLENPPKRVATFVQHELLELADAVEDFQDVRVVFITIPEIGNYKKRFSEFNEAMRVFITGEHRKPSNCCFQLLDWASLVNITDSSRTSTFDRRIRLLLENLPDLI
uniref:Uncharacterized protein n=1 Tax=Acrobeloides nanus TaxID=290746 RepID=A0A914BZS4_9BILA